MRVDQKVERALREWPQTRNDDKKLQLAVWWIEGLNLSAHQKKAFHDKCTPAESITRCRREFQSKGKYRANEAVEKGRQDKFIKTTKKYAQEKIGV